MSYFKQVFSLGIITLLFSCNTGNVNEQVDEDILSGTTTIVADESLFPIVDDEHQIFENNYKRAKINMLYKPHQDVLGLLLSDSIKVAIMTRELTNKEKQGFLDRKIRIRVNKFATDGIALVTGKFATDSIISTDNLKAYLQGTLPTNKTFVFDNQKSSTVEYLMAFSNVKAFQKNFYALSSNKEVITYINEHPNSIGIISVAWMKRPTKDMIAQVEKLKFLAVADNNGQYILPSQSNLKTGIYPLQRSLYIVNCQGKAGLGTGFASFLAGEVGQRIILKSGLAPDSLPSRQLIYRDSN